MDECIRQSQMLVSPPFEVLFITNSNGLLLTLNSFQEHFLINELAYGSR